MPDEVAQWSEPMCGGVLKKEDLQEYGACRIKYCLTVAGGEGWAEGAAGSRRGRGDRQ